MATNSAVTTDRAHEGKLAIITGSSKSTTTIISNSMPASKSDLLQLPPFAVALTNIGI